MMVWLQVASFFAFRGRCGKVLRFSSLDGLCGTLLSCFLNGGGVLCITCLTLLSFEMGSFPFEGSEGGGRGGFIHGHLL